MNDSFDAKLSEQFCDQKIRYLFFSHQLGSIRAAADELGLAPSSISRQISKLEIDLNIELIIKGTHKIKLTQAGLILVDYYNSRNLHFTKLLDHLSGLRREDTGNIIVAIGDGVLSTKTIGEFNTFTKQYSGCNTKILIMASCDIQRQVMEDKIHVGIVIAPEEDSGLACHYKFNQPMRFITSTGSHLARKNAITLHEIATTSLVLLDYKSKVRNFIEKIFDLEGIVLKPDITVNSIHGMLDIVKSGIANTILMDTSSQDDIHHGMLKAIPILHDPFNCNEVQIISRRSRRLPAISRELVYFLARKMQIAQNMSTIDKEILFNEVHV